MISSKLEVWKNAEVHERIKMIGEKWCFCDLPLFREDQKIVELACGHLVHKTCLEAHEAQSVKALFETCPITVENEGCPQKYKKTHYKKILLTNGGEESVEILKKMLPIISVTCLAGFILLNTLDKKYLGFDEDDYGNLSRIPTDADPKIHLFSSEVDFYLSLLALSILGILAHSVIRSRKCIRESFSACFLQKPQEFNLAEDYVQKRVCHHFKTQQITSQFFCHSDGNF